jgi:hypothetical protein
MTGHRATDDELAGNDSDEQNTTGSSEGDVTADTASGGAPEE